MCCWMLIHHNLKEWKIKWSMYSVERKKQNEVFNSMIAVIQLQFLYPILHIKNKIFGFNFWLFARTLFWFSLTVFQYKEKVNSNLFFVSLINWSPRFIFCWFGWAAIHSEAYWISSGTDGRSEQTKLIQTLIFDLSSLTQQNVQL